MRYPLPYAFARTHKLLLQDDGRDLILHRCEGTTPAALGEVMRKHEVRSIQERTGALTASAVAAPVT